MADKTAPDAPEIMHTRPLKNLDENALLEWRWADFHLSIVSPNVETFPTPKIIEPAAIEGSKDELEFVYTIFDYGSKFSTCKQDDTSLHGMSMCKLFYTIEKMIALFIERIESQGVGGNTEVQVAFFGFLLAMRKAFESVINLPHNVVVTNFNPGTWGDKLLDLLKAMSDKGYGYPSETPRDIYKHQPKIESPSR